MMLVLSLPYESHRNTLAMEASRYKMMKSVYQEARQLAGTSAFHPYAAMQANAAQVRLLRISRAVHPALPIAL